MVAVSGGPDSLALLHSLVVLGEKASLRLHVAHFNHDFRGEEADEDARFVQDVANRLGLPFSVEKGDPSAYQRSEGVSSFEEAARELRYSFLARVASSVGASAGALGHTADDQAETVLMRVIRGSGVRGLGGMREVTMWESRRGGIRLVLLRPLLELSREETRRYCQTRGLQFRDDTGNLLMRFTRNRVRHQLMPQLETYNPRVKEALVRLARSASLEGDYLEEEAKRLWPRVASEQEGADNRRIILDAQIMAAQHPAMRRTLLRQAFTRLLGNARRLEETHLRAMDELLSASPGKELALPQEVRLLRGYGDLCLSLGGLAEADAEAPPSLGGQVRLQVPAAGEEVSAESGGWRFTARVVSWVPGGEHLPLKAYLDGAGVGQWLLVRSRAPGDRFQPAGMRGEKKIQDFFVDQKVPRSWRDRVPLVECSRGIAWVVGYRLAQWALARKDHPALEVTFEPRDSGSEAG